MFRITESNSKNDSLQSGTGGEPNRKNIKVDLLDILQDENFNAEEEDIQTFDEFMQAMNSFNFEQNLENLRRSSIVPRPRGLRKNPSVNSSPKNHHSSFLTNKHYSLGPDSNEEQQQTLSYLDVVREELVSRGSNKNMVNSEAENPNTHNSIQLETPTIKNNLNLFMNESKSQEAVQIFEKTGSIRQSSAHSSRSFNGFEQINQYEIKQKLGSGAFSSVHLCRDVHTNNYFAVKILEKKQFRKKLFRKNSQMIADNFMRNEIAILKKMEHPHIIKLYEVIEDELKNKIYLILDYCSKGFINEKMREEKRESDILGDSKIVPWEEDISYRKLLESECKRYFKQMAPAMDYLHNVAKIAHRDIKPENILLSERDQVKISDFGLGTEETQLSSKSGTVRYMPPEIKNPVPQQKINNQAGDIWALGITLLVMLEGKLIDVEDQKLSDFINSLKNISEQCKDFLHQCLSVDPTDRITAAQILDHPWILAKKLPANYTQINITQQEQQTAIIKRHRDILNQITKMHLQV